MRSDPLRPGAAKAALLAMPLVLLVLVGAVAPVGQLLWRSVAETEVAPALPRTLRVLRHWDGQGLPDDLAFETLAADLAALRAAGPAGAEAMDRAARRLAADRPALGEALFATAERAPETLTSRATAVLVADPAWGEPGNWAALRQASGAASGFHLLAALGLRQAAEGGFEDSIQGPGARAVLARGLGMALLATLACLVLAWPLARWIAEASPRRAALLSAVALLPLLAGEASRAAGWSPLFQAGPVAAFVATTLGLLPLMALPLALSLRHAGPRLPRAAAALGLSPWQVFRRIRLPLARRGLVVGGILVLTQALGSFVAAELLAPGSPLAAGVLAAAARAGDWGTAGALAVLLLLPALLATALLVPLRRRGSTA